MSDIARQKANGGNIKLTAEQWDAFSKYEVAEVYNRARTGFTNEAYRRGLGDTSLRDKSFGDPNYSSDNFEIQGINGVHKAGDLNYIKVGAVYAKYNFSVPGLMGDVVGWNIGQAFSHNIFL